MQSSLFENSQGNDRVRIVEPDFGSPLTDLILELDSLRKKRLEGSTHGLVFLQLKDFFHMLESVGSARIEGNNTTIAEYIETKLEENEATPAGIREIQNLENAMEHIEEYVKENPINRSMISELHKMVVHELPLPPTGEGDRTPGEYRKENIRINKATHIPPDYMQVENYMNELYEFVNTPVKPKYDLLKIAIAHHRFVWIHPFRNGNGRTVRLFTYAMLVKDGFNVEKVGRIINPTAIFCNNRNDYYHYLSLADTGEDEKVLQWCEYVLSGLKKEIEKTDKLTDYEFLRKNILLPAIQYSLQQKYITPLESKILIRVIGKQIIQAADIKDLFEGKKDSEISRQIRRLMEKKMLMPEEEGKRKYVLRFDNSYLLRGIYKMLDEQGFLPIRDEK